MCVNGLTVNSNRRRNAHTEINPSDIDNEFRQTGSLALLTRTAGRRMGVQARVRLRQIGERRRLPELADAVKAAAELLLQVDDQTVHGRLLAAAADVMLCTGMLGGARDAAVIRMVVMMGCGGAAEAAGAAAVLMVGGGGGAAAAAGANRRVSLRRNGNRILQCDTMETGRV